MKRFMLFGGEERYYAGGGMSDFLGYFETLETTMESAWNFSVPLSVYKQTGNEYVSSSPKIKDGNIHIDLDWFHVFDTEENKIVFQHNLAHNQNAMTQEIANDSTRKLEPPIGLLL